MRFEKKRISASITESFDGDYKNTRSYKIGQRVSIKGKVGTIIGINTALNEYQVMINGMSNSYKYKDISKLSNSNKNKKVNLKLKKKIKEKSIFSK